MFNSNNLAKFKITFVSMKEREWDTTSLLSYLPKCLVGRADMDAI